MPDDIRMTNPRMGAIVVQDQPTAQLAYDKDGNLCQFYKRLIIQKGLITGEEPGVWRKIKTNTEISPEN